MLKNNKKQTNHSYYTNNSISSNNCSEKKGLLKLQQLNNKIKALNNNAVVIDFLSKQEGIDTTLKDYVRFFFFFLRYF